MKPVSTNNQTQPVPEIPPKNIPCCSPQNKFICILTASVLVLLVGTGSFLLGKYFTQPKPSPTSPIAQVSPTPLIPTPLTDPTVNWKTYKNEKYGYELKYPNNAELKEDPLGSQKYCTSRFPDCLVVEYLSNINIGYVGPEQPEKPTELWDGYTFEVAVRKKAKENIQKEAELWFNECQNEFEALSPLEEVKLPNLSGFQYTCRGLGDFTHFWTNFKNDPEKVLEITWFNGGSKQAEAYKQIINLILSTFRFD